jgi:hypothetical protein
MFAYSASQVCSRVAPKIFGSMSIPSTDLLAVTPRNPKIFFVPKQHKLIGQIKTIVSPYCVPISQVFIEGKAFSIYLTTWHLQLCLSPSRQSRPQ